jgi:hypothetical protein
MSGDTFGDVVNSSFALAKVLGTQSAGVFTMIGSYSGETYGGFAELFEGFKTNTPCAGSHLTDHSRLTRLEASPALDGVIK